MPENIVRWQCDRAQRALVAEPSDRLAACRFQDGYTGARCGEQHVESLGERLVRGDVGGRFGELSDHRTGAFRLFRERLRHRLGGDDAHVVPGVV